MTYRDFFNAMGTIKAVSQLSLPIEKTFKIFDLLNKMSSQQEIFNQTQENLKKRFSYKELDEGKLQFNSEEEAKQFAQEENKILDMEVSIETYKKIELTTADLKDSNITPLEMFQLKDFFDFKE